MTHAYIPKTLLNLHQVLESVFLPIPEPMQGDKWLLASVLQKTIRRGHVGYALKAAYGLWLQDRQSFWRRLHVASVEDVGIANTALVIQTLTATSASLWRRKVGDLRVGLFLVQKLCESNKTRIADELLLIAERSSNLADLRKQFALAEDEGLIDVIVDANRALIERCLAVWYLSGTRKYPSDLMPPRKGQPEDAAEVLRSISAPTELTESCIAVMGRTQWPLSAFTPLIWQEAQKHSDSAVVHEPALSELPQVNGVPIYAADMYTRIGQASFRRLQKEAAELKPFSIQQIGLGVFYREGGLLDKALTSEFYEEHRAAAEIADMECAGLSIPDYMALSDILARNAQALEEIRIQHLERYFDGAEACAV